MPDFRIDPSTGDLDISNNRIGVVDGLDYIAQRIDFLIHTLKGEWFYDKNRGLPYFQGILGKTENVGLIDKLYIDALLGESYIDSVPVFESYIKDRVYYVSFTVSTSYGNLTTSTGV